MKQRTAISVVLLGLFGASLFASNAWFAPLPVQAQVPVNVRTIALLANDLVYDPYAKLIYASVPSSAGTNGNSIAVINPATGAVGPYIFIGSEPNRLALTDDGKYLYVSLDGAATVRRLNLTTRIPEAPFSLGTSSFYGPLYAEEIEARPGCPDELAVSLRRLGVSPRHGGVALYRNGVRQADMTQEHTGSNVIEFCASPAWLYGLNTETSEFGFRRITVGDSGLKEVDVVGSLLSSGYGSDFKCDGGLAYGTSGRLVDPRTKSLLGTFDLSGGSGTTFGYLVRPDATTGRVFFMSSGQLSSGQMTTQLRAFDQTTFLPLGFTNVPSGGSGLAGSLIRWGSDGIAYRLATQSGQGTTQIVLVQSALISGIGTGPVTTSAASFLGGRAAPESIAALFGNDLSSSTASATALPLPLLLMGVSVRVKDALGVERPAPLFFISPMQINYQLPAGTAAGTATVTVTNDSGRTSTGSVNVAAVVPGLFSANANGTGPASGLVLRVKPDNSQSFEPIAEFDATQNRVVLRPIDLGPETDRVFLILFGTGLRGRSDPSKVIGRVGCAEATVAYLGAQGSLVGLDQANLLLPRSQAGRGETTVALTFDGQTTNLVTVNIK